MAQRLNVTLLLIVLLTAFSTAYAQTGTITGKIVDAKTDEPLIGASVLVEGTTHGAAADLDGNFVIQNVPTGNHTLIVSYVAYLTETLTGIEVGNNNETRVEIALLSDDISLEEVEVIARANRESVRSITTGDEAPYQDQVGNKYSRKTSQLALANLNYDINKAHRVAYNFMMLHATNEYTGEYNGRDAEKNQDDPFGVFFRRQQINDNLLLTHQLLSNWTLSNNLSLEAGIS